MSSKLPFSFRVNDEYNIYSLYTETQFKEEPLLRDYSYKFSDGTVLLFKEKKATYRNMIKAVNDKNLQLLREWKLSQV
jgi:hypothetical protein